MATLSLREFARRAYPADKLCFEAQYIWSLRVLVPGGVFLGWLFARLGFTPNQVTYMSHTTAGVGFILVATGQHVSVVIGLLLVNLWQVLDCADGAFARAAGRTSRYGAFIDTLGGYVVYVVLPVVIGLGLYCQPERSLESVLHSLGWRVSPVALVLLPFAFGVLASVAFALRCIAGFLYLEQAQQTTGEAPACPSADSAPGWRQKIRWFRQNWLELPGFMLPMLVVLALVQALSVWSVLYGLLTLLDATGIIVLCAGRLRRDNSAASNAQ